MEMYQSLWIRLRPPESPLVVTERLRRDSRNPRFATLEAIAVPRYHLHLGYDVRFAVIVIITIPTNFPFSVPRRVFAGLHPHPITVVVS